MGTPKGMIAAEEFAKAKGYSLDETISLIRSGYYVGHIIGGQWFVKPEDTFSKTQQGGSEPSAPQPTTTPVLSTILFILAGLSILGGIILSAQFWPVDPGYGKQWKIEAYTISIIWIMAGIVESILFAAIGQGLAYLHRIVQNTTK